MRWAKSVLGAVVVVPAILTGCGGDKQPELTVAAAASLRTAFEAYAEQFADARVRLTFAGSDALAAQIRQGVRPDVYAAANTELPDALHAEGLIEAPTAFGINSLVLAVPSESQIESVADLGRPGTTIAVGSPSVPVGAYTHEALRGLPDGGAAILKNVRSEEPSVAGIIGKLTQGAADAGLVYSSDVEATGGALRAIALPPDLQPGISYSAATVAETESPDLARRFIDGLLRGMGAGALRDAGFAAPLTP